MDNSKEVLITGAKELGITLTSEQVDKLILYKELLLDWNQKINLTSITEPKEIMIKHFLDSLSIVNYLKIEAGTKLIDIGTGAGFPGLPLKIYQPELNLYLLDSLNKRLLFLEELKKRLTLKDVFLIHGRAEDYGKDKKYRQSFDIAVSRAVAKLSVLVEYGLPFLKIGGVFVSYKGPNVNEEVSSAYKAIEIMGGKIKEISDINLPILDGTRKLIVIEKVKVTPKDYPRKPGTPEKKPIS